MDGQKNSCPGEQAPDSVPRHWKVKAKAKNNLSYYEKKPSTLKNKYRETKLHENSEEA